MLFRRVSADQSKGSNPSDQAHFPAQQPSPQPYPRLPHPYEHPRRPRHSGCASPQGSLRAVCLTSTGVLPARSRMRQASDFRETTRRGLRAARPTLVLHVRAVESPPSRVGFVVSKAVGNAVTRNRVKRRLRHLVVPLLAGSRDVEVVVRALPAAATQPDRLAADLTSAWAKCLDRLQSTDNRRGAAPDHDAEETGS